MPPPANSIIIPYHSNPRLFSLSFATLLVTVPDDVEIIVVFNNEDPSALPPAVAASRARVLDLQRSVGYARAASAGAAEARGRTLIFSDADTFYRDRWFEPMTSFHAQSARIGMTSAKLLDPRTGRVIDFGIGFTRYNAPHPQMDLRSDHPLVTRNRRVQAACSACMTIDAELFRRCGGFDADLLNYYTDIDLCLRLQDLGYETWAVADAIAYHAGNSAITHRSAYRADVKALFAAKNHARIRVDMPEYFDAALASLRGLSATHVLIDLSTVADREWHHDLLREYVPIAAVYEYGFPQRDAAEISLIDHLGLTILEFRTPILYFVDRFIALQSNAMWLSMRPRRDDLIVDRNANVALLEDVVRGIC